MGLSPTSLLDLSGTEGIVIYPQVIERSRIYPSNVVIWRIGPILKIALDVATPLGRFVRTLAELPLMYSVSVFAAMSNLTPWLRGTRYLSSPRKDL